MRMTCGQEQVFAQDELCAPPDVCANADDSREQHLLAHQTDEHENIFQKTLKRDKPLIVAILVLVLLMNLPQLRYVLYPFMIFSTWVHESCHGIAAVLVGGGVKELFVYKDGSGLAYTYTSGENGKRAFVASAGYTGTALLGCILLLFRRTRRGPTVGLIGIGCAILLSCALLVRNAFGIVALTLMGVAIIVCGWKLKTKWVGYLYSFLAATCSFNAVNSIHTLFALDQGYVNGKLVYSDAHTVAEYSGMTYLFWAFCWLIFALVMSVIGLVFAIDGHTYRQDQRQSQGHFGRPYQEEQHQYRGQSDGLAVSVF